MPVSALNSSPRALSDQTLTVARSYLASGLYGQAEVLLLDAYAQAKVMPCPDSALLALVLLGDVYRAQRRWANAAGKYNQALALWQSSSWLISNDPRTQPSAFMPALGECSDKLGGDAPESFRRRSKLLQLQRRESDLAVTVIA